MKTTGEHDRKLTSASRCNKRDVLNLTERGLEVEEVNAVDVVGVRDRRDHCLFESCQECIADPKFGATGTLATKTVRLEAASRSPIRVERRREDGTNPIRQEV